MRRSFLRVPLLLGLAALLHVSSAEAARRDVPATRIDPALGTTFDWLRARGSLPPWFASQRRPAGDLLPVVVRTRSGALNVSSKHIVVQHGGKPLASGGYPLRVDATGLRELSANPEVVRVELDLQRRRQRPLEASRTETGVDAAFRALLSKQGRMLDGKGVTVVDIDSGIYVHHPALFRADAGAYAWFDRDGDGVFRAGVDAVDLDGNGQADETEILQLLPATAGNGYGDVVVPTSDQLRPDIDHLYVDENGNGRRDSGRGFDESTPAYGEALFVADDANGNGRLDVGERLLRLGSNKLRKVLTTREYTRGAAQNPLSAWIPDPTYADFTDHGTAVAGILGGGVWGASRWLGLAPEAELLSYDYMSRVDEGTTEALQWAIDEGAHVILTEYGVYTGHPMDGSTEEEQLIDAALDRDILVVSPAGNLVTGGKHATATATTEGVTLALSTDEYFAGSRYAYFTVLDRSDGASLEVSVSGPGGTLTVVPENDGAFVGENLTAWQEVSRTTRGTTMRNVYLYRNDEGPLPAGAYALGVRATGNASVPVHMFTSDGVTGWGYGLTFDEADDASTLCHPATSDRAVAVAAYTLHGEPEYTPWSAAGDLAGYSSRGPRIDGDPGIDVTAPDNPISASVPTANANATSTVTYGVFGGTSGAGPHVAAVAALLRQDAPEESAASQRERLLAASRPAGEATLWGRGKLDVANLFAAPRTQTKAPLEVRIELPSGGLVVRRANRLRAEVAGGAVRSRWDLDYDGVPDTEWVEGLETELTTDVLGARALRVYVVDAEGNLGGATLETTVNATPVYADGEGEDDGGCGCAMPGRQHGGLHASLAALALVGAVGLRRHRRR